MSKFNVLPREEKIIAVKRILFYLKTFPKWMVIIDTSYPVHSMYPVQHIQIRLNSIQMLENKLQRIFLLKIGKGSG
jgi:hypothetical protein